MNQLSYRFIFAKPNLVKEDNEVFVKHENEELIVYAEHVRIQEPISTIKFAEAMVVIEICDGIDRPLLKVTTNKTVDMIVDSKDGTIEPIVNGLWKIRCGPPARMCLPPDTEDGEEAKADEIP